MLHSINSNSTSIKKYLEQLIKKRHLLIILTKREFKTKYNQTFLGLSWIVIQPILVVAIYTAFFKYMMKLNTYNVPYPQYVLSGLVLWYLNSGVISKCMTGLLESRELITKVSFPKIIILIAKIIPVIFECLLLLILAVIFMITTKKTIQLNVFTSAFYFLEVLLFSFSIGLLLSLVVIKFRDVLHFVPFVINFGIWLTPVFYSFESVPDSYKNYLRFGNPLVIPLEGIRDAFFGNKGISMESAILFFIFISLLISALAVFIKFEKRLSENI